MLKPSTRLDVRLRKELHQLTAPGRRRLRRGVGRISRYLVPNPPIRGADWVERNLVIPNGSRPGPVKLDIVQRTIFDLMQDPNVNTVVWLKPPRAGSSTLTALMMIFQAAYDGHDVIFYERSDPEAQNFHDKKLRPILDASTAISHLVRADSRSGIQDSWSDIYLVIGSAIQHRGVQTDSNFKAIRGRWIFIDEAGDKAFLAAGVDSEGHKGDQARTRHAEYPDGTAYIAGTPTTLGCVVVQEHESASVKLRLMMRFPCCPDKPAQPFLPNVSQAGVKGEIIGPGLKFVCDDAGDVTRIGYECAHCSEWLSERQRNDVMEAGSFEPIPGVKGGIAGVVGLETWAIHAKDPGLAWGKIVEKYRAQPVDITKRQDWQNLWLAQPFTPATEGRRDPHELEDRCEDYGAECPAEVLETFAGIDFQEGSAAKGLLPRVEIVTIGVGLNDEKWFLDRHVIDRVPIQVVDEETGEVFEDWERIDPVGPEAMRLIHEYLDRGLRKPDGTIMIPSRVGCDTGYEATKVMGLVTHAESRVRKMFPLKGRKEAPSFFGKRADVFYGPPPRNGRHIKPMILGTQGLKDYIAQCLDVESGQPFSFHFPITLAGTDFFEQLTAEELIYDKKNPDLCKWDRPAKRRDASNEVLDCTVYALAAVHYQKARSMTSRKQLALDPDAAKAKPRGKPRSIKASEPPPAKPVSAEQKAAAARLQAVVSKLPPELRAALGAGIKSTVGKLEAKVAAQPAAPRSAREFLTESLRSSRRREDDDRGRGDSRRGEERTVSRRRGGAADILDW